MGIAGGELLEIVLNMLLGSQQTLNVWTYEVDGSFADIDAVNVAEAWWNGVKTSYRGLASANAGSPFISVKIRELNNPVGDYAEWSIPSGEQAGTRSNPSDVDLMPYHVASGARLTVATRLTRPGQKRFPFATQTDMIGSNVQAAWKVLLGAVLTVACAEMVLGSPALGCVLDPIICKKDAAGTVVAHQPVTGYVVANYASSQNTRKFGRGA